MASSPILGIPLLSTSQAAKEQTINSAVTYLERATNDAVTIDLAGSNLSLPLLDFQRYMNFTVKNVGATSVLTIPATKRLFVLDNRGNANPITVTNGPDTKTLEADAIVVLHSSPTKITIVSNSAWTGFNDSMPSEEPNGKHAYWRLRVLTGVLTNTAEVGELVLRSTINGENLAAGGTPISGGNSAVANDAAKGFDNSLATFWRSQTEVFTNGNTWLGYQFTIPVAITTVEVKMAAPTTDRRIKSGVVEFSDDGVTWHEAWTFDQWVWDSGVADTNMTIHPRYQKVYDNLLDLDDVDGVTPPQDGQVLAFNSTTGKWEPTSPADSDAAVTHRFWRIFVIDGNSPSALNLAEVQFRSVVGSAEQPSGGAVLSGGSLGGSPASQAFDGNDGTVWGASPVVNNYVGYDFLTPKKVTEVLIRRGTTAGEAPRNFRLEWSDNGSSWNVAGVIANKTDWTDPESLITPTLNFQELPDGGSPGQVLGKKSAADGDVEWVDTPAGVPEDGTVGQVLTKNSGTPGDYSWKDATASGGGGARFRGDWGGLAPVNFENGIPTNFSFDVAGATVVDVADAGVGLTKALRFRPIDDNETTYFEFSAVVPSDGTYHIRFMASSELDKDRLIVRLDGVEVASGSGIAEVFEARSFPIAAGTHAVRVSYSKDSSGQQGDDTVYVSQLSFQESGSTAYVAGDTVEHAGSVWLCLVPGTIEEPSAAGAHWRNLTEGGGSGSPELPPLTGNKGKVLTVKPSEDGVEWVEPAGASPIEENASTQWRILFQASGGDPRVGIAEMQMRLEKGGADACEGGAPNVSSAFSGTASLVVDDLDSTQWIANAVVGEWVSYTFPVSVTVREVALTSITSAGNGPASAPADFRVQYFDSVDGTWKTEWIVVGAVFSADAETQVFTKPSELGYEIKKIVSLTSTTTLDQSHLDAIVRFTNAADANYTIPTHASEPLPVGSTTDIVVAGAGKVTIIPQSGVTLNANGSLVIAGPMTKVTLVKIGANSWDVLKATGGEAPKRLISAFLNGTYSASEVVIRYMNATEFTLPASLSGAQISAGTVSTASATFSIRKNGTPVGTITFAAGQATPSVSFTADIAFAAGDVLSLIGPASPDATLADISLSFIGK